MKKSLVLFIMLLVSMTIVSAVVMTQNAKKPPPVLVFGITHEAPYAYINEKGVMDGLFAQAVQQITAQLQISDYHWQVTKFNNLLNDLQSGRISVIGSGIAVTKERAAQVCFAEPLLQAKAGLLKVKQSATESVDAEQNLRYLVLAGSVEQAQLGSLLDENQLTVVERVSEGVSLLKAGEADALALSWPTLLAATEKYPDEFIITDNPLMRGFIYLSAFALDEDLLYLLEDWNQAQRILMTIQGFVDYATSLGFSIPDLPVEVSGSCYAR